MKLAASLLIALPFASVAPAAAAPSPSIFQKGRPVSGTCFAKFRGTVLINGRCSGLGHGRFVFVTSAKDACTLMVTRSGEVEISAYRGECGKSDLGDLGEPIGRVKPAGKCLVGASARLCLTPGRGIMKNAW